MKKANQQLQDYYFEQELDNIKNNKAKDVYFSGDTNTHNTTNRLIEVLKDNNSVKTFKLNHYLLNTTEAEAIVNYLLDLKAIDNIIFESSTNDTQINSEVIEILFKILNNGPKINCFTMSLDKLNIQEFIIFSSNLVNNNSLVKLILPHSKINDIHISLILGRLSSSKAIELMDFSGNNITDFGTIYIKQFLETNNSIKQLILMGNKITEVQIFKQALMLNESLTELNLNSNYVRDYGIGFWSLKKAIVTFLKINAYINQIINNQNNSKAISSNLELELSYAKNLKSFVDEKIMINSLEDLDQKIKCNDLKITPTPLEIILKSEKFLKVMQTYIFKLTGENYANQDEVIKKTIELLKSGDPQHKLYSFYQFVDAEEANSSDFNISDLEKKAISAYQIHSKYLDAYLKYIDKETRGEIIANFMSKDIEASIQIQQLYKIFKDDLPREFRKGFESAIDIYEEMDSYQIEEIGESRFILGHQFKESSVEINGEMAGKFVKNGVHNHPVECPEDGLY